MAQHAGIITIDQMNEEVASARTECAFCGKPLGNVRYVCPLCRMRSCSEVCRARHIEEMENV